MWIFALTIFTGAFLLFQVQPLIAKFILPWFGGSAAVWTTCMLFFQIFLVAGYGYALAGAAAAGAAARPVVTRGRDLPADHPGRRVEAGPGE